jgi:hypothetical protein
MASVLGYILMADEKPKYDTTFNTDRYTYEQAQKIAEESCSLSDTIDYFYYDEDPGIERENNKFGLYIYAEVKDFIRLADKLVNSKGGDWGYVLIPYNVDDRDRTKWDSVFRMLEDKHLIPIIQLYDADDDNYEKELVGAAEFLNQFVWPVRQRYISVYNEPNDARFWYGRVDPGEYARVLDKAILVFKEENPNFFMLNGALNASARSQAGYMDSFNYMYFMNEEVPGIFDKLDGWASHPYPQPNFSGSPYDSGRGSIKAYESELDYLTELGVGKELPVFITETGWAHAEGEAYNSTFLNVTKVSENLKIAFEEIWLPDDRVQAVVPFTIWYPPPYDHFSWVNRDRVPYEHYEVVKSMDKVAGNPEKLMTGTVRVRICDD